MTNLEVAQALITNALAYGKRGDIETVMSNLRIIEVLLESPNEKNEKYDWDDFK